MADIDTIAAVATPPGCGGICIIRASGPEVVAIAKALLGLCPKPRVATFSRFMDADHQLIDEGLALYFPSPNSFTGEDVLELHGHGGRVVSDMLLKAVLDAGARMALAGEFSQRAFLNNKLDLVQAEAIADLIDAGSQRAAKAALRTLEGEFSVHINSLLEELVSLRVYVESSLDFSDEEIELLQQGDIQGRLQRLHDRLKKIRRTAHRGQVLGEGLHIVIAGRPNAGKSSLMNSLSGRDSAIVTDIPGTTRDVIREQLLIEGIPVHLHDTAGLRDEVEVIEQEGIRRARESLLTADVVIWIHDDSTEIDRQEYQEFRQSGLILVRNKIDLTETSPGTSQEDGISCIAISTKSQAGLEELRKQIARMADVEVSGETDFSARRRHLDALERAEHSLDLATQRLREQIATTSGGELLAEELRQAQHSLNEITGEFTSDDLLGKIFTEFCIGK